ncbi:MAG TPA: ABC transporter substrate-binding protein [bacterium]|nr:ABC transporter substrate-binding protein [bacterium]
MQQLRVHRSGWIAAAAVVVLALFLSTTGTFAQTPAPGGSVTIAFGTDALTLDPHNYKAATDIVVSNLIFDTLVQFDLNLHIRPALALDWLELSSTSWRFDLRQGVKFSDGTPFNAQALKTSMERAAAAPRSAGYVGVIAGVDVVNDYRVVIRLKRPFAPFLQNLAAPVAAVLSPSELRPGAPDPNTHPVGTGPFMLADWTPNQQLRLVRNPTYWGRKPYLDQVVFRTISDDSTRYLAFRGGQVDVISNPPSNLAAQIRSTSNLTLDISPSTRDVRVGFTVTKPPFDNVKVRQALAMAIDRGPIIKYVLNGLGREATCGMIPPEVMATMPCADVPFDAAKAKQMLAEAGFPNGFTTEFWTPEGRYLGDRQIAETVQQQLQQINVKADVKVMEWGAYLDALARHQGPIFLIGWGWITGDPAQALAQNFQSHSAFNYWDYNNPDFDKMLTDAEASDNPIARQKMYDQMESILLVRDTVAKEIYYTNNIYGVNKRVHGFHGTPVELIDLSQTWVTK